MIKISGKILLIILGVILQVVLVPSLGIYGVWPNLILIIALMLILLNFDDDALLWAGLGGLLLDLASPLAFGIHTILIIFLVVLSKFLVNKYLTELNMILMAVIVGINAVIYSLIFDLVLRNEPYLFLLIDFFYSILVAMAIYLIYLRFYRLPTVVKVER